MIPFNSSPDRNLGGYGALGETSAMTVRATRSLCLVAALVAADARLGAAPLVVTPQAYTRDEADPTPAPNGWDGAKPTAAQLRARATAAEAAGDWEAAFAAYCEYHAADPTGGDAREKLNAALRRVQQHRRHRDPAFRQFVASLSAGDAVNLYAETTGKIPGMFADPDKSTPQQLWVSGVEELDRAFASREFRRAFLDNPADKAVETFRASLKSAWTGRTVRDARDARAAAKQLVAAAQDAVALRHPAAVALELVCGACAGLDEYTVYLTPDPSALTPAPADLSAHGLYLGFQDGGLLVEGVAPGSWAAFHTPLRKGDRISRVNGRPVHDAAALSDALRVPVGGFHELEHATPAPGLPALSRLPVTVPTVYGERIVNPKDGVGYVRVGEFQPSTPREFTDAVARLRLDGLRALILDLRGNRGGSFVAGVEVARRLLPHGLIVTTQGQLPSVAGQVFSSDSGMAALDHPLVVLIDGETASAAEVVAAAVRDNNRGVLVGAATFGKGTIQYPLKLSAADGPDGATPPRARSGTVRVTIARLIAPRGAPINGVGVSPAPGLVDADPGRQFDLALEQAVEQLQPMFPRSPAPPPPPQ